MLSDEVKLSRGACWIGGTSIIILNFVFLLLGWAWLGANQPELNGQKIDALSDDVKAVTVKVDEIQKMLNDQAVKDAEIKGRDFGYRVGRADKKDGH